MYDKTCVVCEKPFTTKNKKTQSCSRACANTNRMNQKPKRYCDFCKKEITDRPRCWIRHETAFCNKTCEGEFRKKSVFGNCAVCDKPIESRQSAERVVCSKDCMKIHLRNKYIARTATAKRSFVEVFLVHMLRKNFPEIEIVESERTALFGYEIDIFLPKLNIGIECCGIHHYLPINGEEALRKVQTRDELKRKIAESKNIKIITLKYLYSVSKTARTKLTNLFLELCELLKLEPSNLEVDMKHVDNLYRSVERVSIVP